MEDSKKNLKILNGVHLKKAKILEESVTNLANELEKAINNLKNTRENCKTTCKLIGNINDTIAKNSS